MTLLHICEEMCAYVSTKSEQFDKYLNLLTSPSIELTVTLIAASITSLEPLVKAVLEAFPNYRRPVTSARPSAPQTNQSSHTSRYSSQTVIYRPNTAYFPSFTRFHDDVSNLDFDIETPVTRSRAHTLRSRGSHSRNVSDWSQFSGFTYYTNPTEPPELEPGRIRSAEGGVTELEEIIKGLGLGSNGRSGLDIGLALTAMHASLPHERGEGTDVTGVDCHVTATERIIGPRCQDEEEDAKIDAQGSGSHGH